MKCNTTRPLDLVVPRGEGNRPSNFEIVYGGEEAVRSVDSRTNRGNGLAFRCVALRVAEGQLKNIVSCKILSEISTCLNVFALEGV